MQKVCLGEIIKAQGLKGTVKVKSFTCGERFLTLSQVFLEDHLYQIESVRLSGSFVLLKLQGVSDRKQAEAITGKRLFIPNEQRASIPSFHYFIDDLIDLLVISTNGREIGYLKEVWSLPANDVFLVEGRDGEQMLIPALKDVVRKIDLEQKTMLVEEWGIVE